MSELAHSEETTVEIEVLRAGGGLLYPFLNGYDSLELLLRRLPSEAWRRDEDVLGGQVLLLVKRGQAARAKSYLSAIDIEFEKTERFIVLELLLALHLGEPVSERKLRTWRRLERTLPLSDPLLIGLYYNAMMAMYVRLGRISDARVTGQQAISCYREASHVYLEHFIHIHLADLDIIEGRLHRATQRVSAAEGCLAQSGLRYGNEDAVIEIIRLAIHYERGELALVRRRSADLRNSLLIGDSWSELFIELTRIAVLSAYFLDGREVAFAELADFQADYARRHNGEAAAMDGLKALIWHLDWHAGAAERTWEQLRDVPAQSAVGELLAGELGVALGLAEATTPSTPRGRIVEALQHARTAKGQRRWDALERALRLGFDEGHIAPFLEHRDVFLGAGNALAGRGGLKAKGQVARMANRVLKMVSDSYVVPETLRRAGFSRRQYRVVAALQSGATNKQIARHLGTTEATVKYHLTSLYKLTGTQRRHELIDYASEKLTLSVS
ncbi:MAG: LuxR C-terminal-related transcriptional regulator [Pseudomonadota bacterium]